MEYNYAVQVKIYTGLSHTNLVDQSSHFGETFADIRAVSGTEVRRTGTEAQWSLNVGEICHEPLRTTDQKLRFSFPKNAPTVIFYLSVKAMKDTIGLEGLVSSSFVFREMLSVRTIQEPLIQKRTLS